MAHRRSLIFSRIVSILQAIEGFEGEGKVKRGRNAAVPQELLPALTPTWAESSETMTIRPGAAPDGADGYERVLPISIVVHMRTDHADEEFDRIAVLIESAMGSDMKLGGLVTEVIQTSSRLFIDTRNGLALGAGTINFQVYYKTAANNPELAAA